MKQNKKVNETAHKLLTFQGCSCGIQHCLQEPAVTKNSLHFLTVLRL